jgi:hypothetical protein
MRLALLALACLIASPVMAQPPVDSATAYFAGGHACQAMILQAAIKDADNSVDAAAMVRSAGFSRDTTHPARMEKVFFPSGGKVEWFKRPANGGVVYLAFSAEKAQCFTFLMGRMPGDVSNRFIKEVGEGWVQVHGQATQYFLFKDTHHLMVSEAYDAEGATGEAGSLGAWIDIHYFP